MAVKTPFTDDTLATVLSQYDLGTYTSSEPVLPGTVETTYFIQTTKGKFVFRYYENRSKESVLFESELLAHLTERRYPCPAPFRNTEGAYVGTYQDKPFMVLEFLAGRPIKRPDAHHKRQLIQKAAELQILTQDFRSRYTPHRWNYSPELCRTLARAEAARINTEDAYRKLDWLERELATLHLPPSLPKGICHCDFHFSNVLFREDEFAALLDFDDANYTFLQFDLVGLIEYWASPHHARLLDAAQARAITQAYMRHRPLAPAEQRHLYDVYKLSILIDCVWYFERGPAADFREKSKIEALTNWGRRAFYDGLFGA